MAAATSVPISRAAHRTLRLAPSLPDLFFALLLVARFGRLESWQALLGDGDTGWHIRAGEYILAHGVPAQDLFSFSRPHGAWYAWEWLSELIFARVHGWFGLPGVAALGAVLVCLAAALVFAWLLRRGSGAWVALAVALAAASAASVHDLARPHLFSLVLLVAGLWLLDEDRRSPTPWLWTLVPVAGLWANLHGGFTAWIAILWLLAAVCAVEWDGRALARYGLLAGLSTLATLVNPYGWQLHRHIWEFLGSRWITEHVEEFQSPQIRTEGMWVFALLLLAGVAVAARVGQRGRRFEAALVLVLAFAALASARNVPLFALAAAPLVASYVAARWRESAERAKRSSPCRVFWESSQALGARWGFTPWMPVLGGLALAAVCPSASLADFPAKTFPATAVRQCAGLLSSPAGSRVLTSDQWADYLIYRLYPRTRVFFDGRSDFYGQSIAEDYRVLLVAGRSSRDLMARYGFTAALLPLDWPLAQILQSDPGWRVAYRDRQAVLMVKAAEAAK